MLENGTPTEIISDYSLAIISTLCPGLRDIFTRIDESTDSITFAEFEIYPTALRVVLDWLRSCCTSSTTPLPAFSAPYADYFDAWRYYHNLRVMKLWPAVNHLEPVMAELVVRHPFRLRDLYEFFGIVKFGDSLTESVLVSLVTFMWKGEQPQAMEIRNWLRKHPVLVDRLLGVEEKMMAVERSG
jgi:hypothetical protein